MSIPSFNWLCLSHNRPVGTFGYSLLCVSVMEIPTDVSGLLPDLEYFHVACQLAFRPRIFFCCVTPQTLVCHKGELSPLQAGICQFKQCRAEPTMGLHTQTSRFLCVTRMSAFRALQVCHLY